MSSSASPAPSRRKTLLSLGVLALLTGIVVFIFREHWAEISEALSRLTLGQGLLALTVGLSYPLLEGVSSWLIVRSRLSHFPLRQGIDNAWMGTFGNVVGLGAGSVPFQTWYLHRRGLDVGPGVGLMTLQYVFHKTAVLLYATVLLLAGRPWMAAHSDGVLRYLPGAYAVVAGMGSVETAFLLVYSSFLPDASSMSLLMFYRLASYYAVFATSAVGFALAQRRLNRG